MNPRDLLEPLSANDQKLCEQIFLHLGMSTTEKPSRKRTRASTGVSIKQLRAELSCDLTAGSVLSNGQTVGEFLFEQWKKQHRTTPVQVTSSPTTPTIPENDRQAGSV
jgi:hypothetical protein